MYVKMHVFLPYLPNFSDFIKKNKKWDSNLKNHFQQLLFYTVSCDIENEKKYTE